MIFLAYVSDARNPERPNIPKIVVFIILPCLGLENLGNNTSQATFFLLFNLVYTVSSDTGAERQQVHCPVVKASVDSLRNVVNDTGLESTVDMVQHEGSKSGVNDGGGRTSERRTNQW